MKQLFYIIGIVLLNSCSTESLNLESTNMNPFFTEYDTPYQIPPFKKIKDEHYMPAFNQGMKEQLEEIGSITNNLESPSFENTIVELERTGKTLDKVSNVFFNLNSSNTNDQMDAIAKEISPKLSAHRDNIFLNRKLFERVKTIYEQKNNLDLNTEQKRLVEETYKYFIRSGAQLNSTSMRELTAINQELSSLSVQFDQNLLKETNEGFHLLIEEEKQLDPNIEARLYPSAANRRSTFSVIRDMLLS